MRVWTAEHTDESGIRIAVCTDRAAALRWLQEQVVTLHWSHDTYPDLWDDEREGLSEDPLEGEAERVVELYWSQEKRTEGGRQIWETPDGHEVVSIGEVEVLGS